MMNIEDYIKTYFSYSPKTGKITRHDRANSNGSYDHYGYLILKVKGKQFKAHRIAWFLHYGKWPKNGIDHINRIRDDNRITNLRDVPQSENCKNVTVLPNSETGEKYIYLDKTKGLKKKYQTKINGKTYRFYTITEAKQFRNEKLSKGGNSRNERG